MSVGLADIGSILGAMDIQAIRDFGAFPDAYSASADDDGVLFGNADPNAAKATANDWIADCS